MIAKFVRSSTIEYMPDISKEYLDNKLDKLATKDDLKDLEGNLKLHVEQEVSELASMVSRRFDELEEKLDLN